VEEEEEGEDRTAELDARKIKMDTISLATFRNKKTLTTIYLVS
jgi:hypothetical protein